MKLAMAWLLGTPPGAAPAGVLPVPLAVVVLVEVEVVLVSVLLVLEAVAVVGVVVLSVGGRVVKGGTDNPGVPILKNIKHKFNHLS